MLSVQGLLTHDLFRSTLEQLGYRVRVHPLRVQLACPLAAWLCCSPAVLL